MKISIYPPECLNEIGNRPNQEDSVYPEVGQATAESSFFIVCDGMGGHEHGELASQTVCHTLAEYINCHWNGDYFSDDLFHDALHAAIYEINKLDDNSVRKPGTTMTFLCLHRGGVIAAHIGDSRIYHIRPSEERILYKSRDHSLVYDLFLAGEITEDEMSTYNKKNVLTRAILPNMDQMPKADIAHITDICAGDYFVLCTDGLLENLNDRELVSLLEEDDPDEEKSRKISQETSANADNHSLYIIHIKDVEKERSDELLIDDENSTKWNSNLLEKSMINESIIDKLISKIIEWKNSLLLRV